MNLQKLTLNVIGPLCGQMVPEKFKDYKTVNVTINTCEYRYIIIIIRYDVFLTVNRPSIKIFTVFPETDLKPAKRTTI